MENTRINTRIYLVTDLSCLVQLCSRPMVIELPNNYSVDDLITGCHVEFTIAGTRRSYQQIRVIRVIDSEAKDNPNLEPQFWPSWVLDGICDYTNNDLEARTVEFITIMDYQITDQPTLRVGDVVVFVGKNPQQTFIMTRSEV